VFIGVCCRVVSDLWQAAGDGRAGGVDRDGAERGGEPVDAWQRQAAAAASRA